jgi:hypothetical protein
MVEALPSLHARVVVGPVEQSCTIPAHGTHIFPLQSKMVCTSLIVHGLASSQLTTDFVPLLQSVSIPAQGTQILPSLFKMVSISFVVHGLLSLQG